MSTLRFLGDFGLWPSLLLALALAALAWSLYKRDVAGRSPRMRLLLPALRAAAVFLATMMLAGPVLHHRRVVGELLRLHVVLDGSRSMALRDPQMDAGRKLMIANRLGWTDTTALDTGLLRAADRLAAARESLAAETAVRGTSSPFKVFAAAAEEAYRELEKVQPEALRGVVSNGSISYERWDRLPGSELASTLTRPEFKAAPDVRENARELASRFNADDYLERFRGYVSPPASGDYTFWVTGDDDTELWLSSSEDPGLKSRIANVPGWAPFDGWEQHASQKSRRIPLVTGRRYYIEVLHKEGGGDGHVTVRWSLPDGRMESPIPGSRLAPFAAETAGDPRKAFATEVLEPARQLAGKAADDAGARNQLAGLQRSADVWEREFRESFARHAERLAAEGNASVKAVLDRFDKTTRWERMVALLWSGREPALGTLAEDHDVELSVLQGTNVVSLWRPRAGGQEADVVAPEAVSTPPNAGFTDLAAVLSLGAGDTGVRAGEADRTPGEALVLLTDGAHNALRSPVTAARAAGARGVPVFTVAVGTERLPADAAIVSIDAPESAFHKDRLRGRLLLDDRLPAGRPIPIRILSGTKPVWSQDVRSTGEGVRAIDFDFALEELAREAAGPGRDEVLRAGIRLDLRAELGPLEGDAEAVNNTRAFEVFAVLREYKVLLVDSRPRWEWRYLDNLFDRDRKWKVNSVLVGDQALKRGGENGQFPADREQLFTYDLIVLGDIAFDLFRREDLELLRDFVGQRGGGLVLIDSERGQLSSREAGPLDPALPADWVPAADQRLTASLRLASAAGALPAFDLGPTAAGTGSAWTELPPPHHVVGLKPRAGSEVLVEGMTRDGKPVPVIVHRRFGAGQVMHMAFDETWRWRYRVADRHHARFWNQMATWLMESPYAARDARASLDAGAPSYQPGERAPIRVRLRDREGRAMTGAAVFGNVYRDGKRVASIPLAPDESGGGAYRADTAPLEPGVYEVRVTVGGEAENAVQATVSFAVREKDAGELARLTADETTLRQIASASRGTFHREEDLDALLAELKPLSRGRIVESETVLWQEWPWFAVIMALVTLEWLLRKKEGML